LKELCLFAALFFSIFSNTHCRCPTEEKEGMESEQPYYTLLQELAVFLTDQEKQVCSKKTKIEITAEAGRLLRDSAIALAESRPPPDFVVYSGDEITTERDPHRPPIFDGSVANATPPPLGTNANMGGAGTILHLACALDAPLALAFLLAMGADARASHTAFRRLMIHEAACNGSVNCLTLLLELGRKYGKEDAVEDARAALNSLPFLPRRMDRAEAVAPLFYARNGFFVTARRLVPPSPDSPPPPPPPENNDFLTLLGLFREYVAQVQQKTLTELDAARKLMDHAVVSAASQGSLARSCHFSASGYARTEGSSSDGHGNTPLHWAAFKNETDCVSLLLKYNADPNARAHPSGWTPLHDAAYSNSTETIELLMNAGASVDARANSGATPLCFAAQEDAAQAAAMLLVRGADLTTRCAGGPVREDGTIGGGHSRFSGYTPLHYCAHYNANKAAKVLLQHPTSLHAMEIPDLSERLPIHVAVARGSSDVLKELLHAGARVETRQEGRKRQSRCLMLSSSSSTVSTATMSSSTSSVGVVHPSTPTRRVPPSPEGTPRSRSSSRTGSTTPVSSPLLRSMIPAQPINSSKPWNCLSQRSIDECRALIGEAEQFWTPDRHLLFTPADRKAVMELLRVGKRLEQEGEGLHVTVLWPQILSFCGRGWFEVADGTAEGDEEEEEEEGDDEDSFLEESDNRLSLPRF
jgi:hypothetical protein